MNLHSRVAVSLFDESGNMVRPWANAGFLCICVDLGNEGKQPEFIGDGVIQYFKADLADRHVLHKLAKLNPKIIFGFPPCTHLTVAGARHFERKRNEDPMIQFEAVELCRQVEYLGSIIGSPWMLENPISMLSSMWRKPDYRFHPHEYGGYLSINDEHPRWPRYIPPRDAYEKTTCIWAGNGFIMPPKKSVEPITLDGFSPQMQGLGGSSEKTKQIRSETPRGFAQATFLANKDGL